MATLTASSKQQMEEPINFLQTNKNRMSKRANREVDQQTETGKTNPSTRKLKKGDGGEIPF